MGRLKSTRAAKRVFRDASKNAADAIVELSADKSVDVTVRMTALKMILEHGIGKPGTQKVQNAYRPSVNIVLPTLDQLYESQKAPDTMPQLPQGVIDQESQEQLEDAQDEEDDAEEEE